MNKAVQFNFKKDILYPACAIFFVLVFLYFLVAMAAGLNVTESETTRTQYYDGETNTGNLTSETKDPAALPVQTLLGLFLFGASVVSLGLVRKLNVSKLTARLIHYVGTVAAFLIFVIALSGAVSSTGVPMTVVAIFAVSIIYFIVLGIATLVKKPLARLFENKRIKGAKDFIAFTLAGFTAVVFAVSLFALITQLSVIVRVSEEKIFVTDKAFDEVYVTVVTPLAPTLQNYLRYLASAAVFALGYAVLFTGLKKTVKAALNFVILTAGYMGIWIIGFDYFRLVKSNALPAVIIYLSIYLAALITVCIILYVKRRQAEETEAYESQFSVGRRN